MHGLCPADHHIPYSCCDLMADLMSILGISLRWGRQAPVTGEVVWCCSHCSIACLSYVCPSAAITGSCMRACINHHKGQSGLHALISIPLHTFHMFALSSSHWVLHQSLQCPPQWELRSACSDEHVCKLQQYIEETCIGNPLLEQPTSDMPMFHLDKSSVTDWACVFCANNTRSNRLVYRISTPCAAPTCRLTCIDIFTH